MADVSELNATHHDVLTFGTPDDWVKSVGLRTHAQLFGYPSTDCECLAMSRSKDISLRQRGPLYRN
jgi:hypothetical protein